MELDFDSSEEFRGVAGAMMFVPLRFFHLCHLPGSFSEAFSAGDSLRPQKQDRHADTMSHSRGCRAQKNVSQETVSMGAHRNQIAALLTDPFDDFFSRITVRQFSLRRDACGLKFGPDPFQICRIFRNFRTDGIGTVGSGSPSVRDMKQHHPAVSKRR